MVSWDTVGGFQALGCPQGPPQTGFGVAQDGPMAVLAVSQGKFGWKTVKILQVGFGGVLPMFPDGFDAFWAL